MIKTNNKLYIIGSINVDLIMSFKDLPDQGETIKGEQFLYSLGGKGANQAYYASQMGMEVVFVSKIGNDIFGRFALDELKRKRIDKNIIISFKYNTGVALILNIKGDNRIILDGDNANSHLSKEDIIALKQIRPNDFLLLQWEINEEINYYALKLAKKRGATTFLNLSPVSFIKPLYRQYIDFLVVNEHEFEFVFEQTIDHINLANNFIKVQDLGFKNIILTMGAKGSIIYYDKQIFHSIAKKIDVINSAGAGDSFIGSFIYSWNQTGDINISLIFANNVATQICLFQETQVIMKELVLGGFEWTK